MKILWINHRDIRNPRAGGAERTINEVGKRLVLAGHEVDVLTGGWQGALRHETIDGIHIHRYGNRAIPHLVNPCFLKFHSDADVIVDDMAHAAPWFSPWFSDKPGVVFFHHLHSRTLMGQTSAPIASFLALFERHYSFIYKSWPFITESLSSQMDLNSLGIDSRRITRIPPGVDTDMFSLARKSEYPSVVYFGGMRPYKRPEHALMALEMILKNGFVSRMTMVGDGPSLPFLKSLAVELGISDKVSFPGKVTDRELASIVSSSWVNIHCSLSEGWGFSVLEAAASGTPTVAYRVPGIEETVANGKTGILVDDGDVVGLSNAIVGLLKNNNILGAACRSHAERYSWDTTTSMWEKSLMAAASSP